jgi:hypothetical protein
MIFMTAIETGALFLNPPNEPVSIAGNAFVWSLLIKGLESAVLASLKLSEYKRARAHIPETSLFGSERPLFPRTRHPDNQFKIKSSVFKIAMKPPNLGYRVLGDMASLLGRCDGSKSIAVCCLSHRVVESGPKRRS